MNVLFEDHHLIIVEKPAALLTQSTDRESQSLENEVKSLLQKKYHKETIFLKSLHRLDKDVSGIVMFARSSKAVERMARAIKEHRVTKRYCAEVEGVIEQQEKTLVHFLEKKEFRSIVHHREVEGAKRAQLHFKVIERKRHTTLIDIDLITGRYHQIRAQLSAFGHPIVGDVKYGAKSSSGHIHLRHYYLQFIHPVTQKEVVVDLNRFIF
ncbi:MAG: RNA pseudouridine synthase [Simkaniaceae bacterium]|nr:RNA pseudouridine synthase [Simkaniaceae bacterium]